LKLKVHSQILIAIILGLIAGLVLGERAAHIKIIGDIFIRLLRMIIIPLILASMVAGVVSLGDTRKLGQLGLRTFAYYAATTILAVTVGLVLVNLIKPGIGVKIGAEQIVEWSEQQQPSATSIIEDIVPTNLLSAMAKDKVLSTIFFALLLGVAISSLGEKGKPLVILFEALNGVMMKITRWIMYLAPFAVFSLMADTIGRMGLGVMRPLALYMATVVIGLTIHAVLTLPLLLFFIGRYSPVRFIKGLFNAVATAFSTASSAATLPVTMDCVQKNAGVSNKVASFVLPLGATVNMDGTALYEAVAAMFIAQVYGIELTFAQQAIIMLTATLASIGAAAIPGAGLVTMVIVLKAVNLPIEGIGMILAVDRLLDMFRTAVNVWGDACGTVVVARLSGEKLNATVANDR